MKENSIEEDITRVKQRIEDVKEYIEYGLPYSEYLDLENSFDNILSDYKRVLKENEELKEYNMEYKRILDLADNRIYRKKYLEERRKEQPNLLYPDGDEIYQRYYELKEENEHNKLLLNLNNNFTIDKKNGNYKWNVIEIQKIKDKIEELNKLLEEDLQDEIKVNSNRFIIICQCKSCLQELLGSEE